MNTEISYKMFPIRSHWLIAPLIRPAVLSIIYIFLFVISILFVPLTSFSGAGFIIFSINILLGIGFLLSLVFAFPILIYRCFKKKVFQYIFTDQYIIIRDGIINKSERTIPYSVIQNVVIGNDLSEFFLDLSTLEIENASGAGFGISATTGFATNYVKIPYLSKNHANYLKGTLLQKVSIYKKTIINQGL